MAYDINLANQQSYAKVKYSKSKPKGVGKSANMALIMAKENQLLVFKALFVQGSHEFCLVEELVKAGVSFSCGLYKIIAITDEYKKTNSFPEVQLPVGTSNLIKNFPVGLEELGACRKLVRKWLQALYSKHITKELDEEFNQLILEGIKEAGIMGNVGVTKKAGVSYADPQKNQVIALKDAITLGQKVRGTSPGAVYYCVALNPRVKMAVKLGEGSISFRVESVNATSKEDNLLDSIGFNSKGDYRSMHLNIEDVPIGKVIGAVLMGCGVRFDQIITNVEDIPKGK